MWEKEKSSNTEKGNEFQNDYKIEKLASEPAFSCKNMKEGLGQRHLDVYCRYLSHFQDAKR